jgi:hypothetical protein
MSETPIISPDTDEVAPAEKGHEVVEFRHPSTIADRTHRRLPHYSLLCGITA